MLDPKICSECWRSSTVFYSDGWPTTDIPWQCRLPTDTGGRLTLKMVEHTEDPPRGCHKMFEQAVYNTLLKKS